mgnify:CR=1 FL=1
MHSHASTDAGASMIKTAVIGYGLSAKTFHLPFIALQPELELVAISSSQPELRLDYPDIKHYQNGDELIRLSDAELVVITSPNDSHYLLAKQALLAGKHVVVDKPVTVNSWEAEELEKLASENERRAKLLLQKEAISQEEYDIASAEFRSLKSQTQLIQAQIAKTTVRAPFSGKIGLRAISKGTYVTPETVIAKLVNTSHQCFIMQFRFGQFFQAPWFSIHKVVHHRVSMGNTPVCTNYPVILIFISQQIGNNILVIAISHVFVIFCIKTPRNSIIRHYSRSHFSFTF